MLQLLKILSQIDIKNTEIEIPMVEVTNRTVPDALEIVFGVLAVVAMLIIVLSGLQFSLSRGNPEKAGKARNGVIYAAVGLGLALMAFTVVRFVIKGVA